MNPRDLLLRYYAALVTHEPAGDLSTKLAIGKQIALCHIFSDIVDDNENTRETKWALFKKYWEATRGATRLLNLIEPVFHAEEIDETPLRFVPTHIQDLDWSSVWALVDLVGNIVEDYARSSVVEGDGTPQLRWLQSPKKREGTFFTPPDLARFIAGRIEEIWDQSWIGTRIFDPSVGCGHFLLALAEIYTKRVKSLDHDDFQQFLKNNLFGVDQDLAAVTATALLLGLTGGDGSVVAAVRNNIYQADTLQMDLHDQYHIVIGNPPWGCVRGAGRKIYGPKYPMCNDFENFEYFSVQGLDATILGGLHAFVVPNTFFRNILSVKFREWYAARAQFMEIHDFSNVSVFAEPKVRSSVFIAKKSPSSLSPPMIYIHTGRGLHDVKTAYKLTPNWFQTNIEMWHLSHVPPTVLEGIYRPILSRSLPLGNYTESKQGFIPYRFTTLATRLTERFRDVSEENSSKELPVQEILQGVWPAFVPPPSIPIPTRETYRSNGHDLARRIVKERLWHREGGQDAPLPAGYLPLLKGRDVRAFSIHWRGASFAYGSHVSSYVEERFFTRPRLLFPEIAGTYPYQVQAAYALDPFVHDPQVLNAVFKNEIDPRWHWFCLAAANSLPISVFMAISAPKTGKGLFSKLLVQDVKRIPIPLDLTTLKQVRINLKELSQRQDLSDLTSIVQGEDLQPALGLETAMRIAVESTHLCGQESKGGNELKQFSQLRDLNDLLFSRLFNIDLELCRQAAMGKI